MASIKIKKETKIKLEIALLEIVLIGAAVAILFVNKVENYNFESDATYFCNGVEYEIPAGSKARFDEDLDSVVIKIDKEVSYEACGEPVYFSSDRFISIDDYIWFDIYDNSYKAYKLSYLTEYREAEYGIKATREEGTAAIEGGFLFDGSDTYIMMEDATLEFNNKSVNMPAMSYARVNKGNWIVFYDANKDYVTFEYLDDDQVVSIRDKNNTFVIYPETDLMDMSKKDEKIMLFSNPDLYTLYDFGG